MGMFDLKGVENAQVATSGTQYLRAGVHDVIFKGLDKVEGFDAFDLHFEGLNGALHNERVFEPKSADRIAGQYGDNPSHAEQFRGKIMQIIDALDPEIAVKIKTDPSKFSAPDFNSFVKLLKKYLDPKVGTQVQIKLLPNGKYTSFPGFPMRLTKDGVLMYTTKFIGSDLALDAKEMALVEKAATATPTIMNRRASSELDDLKAEFGDDLTKMKADDDDDLPF